MHKTDAQNWNLNQHSAVRTARMCVRITVHNCRTAWNSLFSLLLYPLDSYIRPNNIVTVIIALVVTTEWNYSELT